MRVNPESIRRSDGYGFRVLAISAFTRVFDALWLAPE
jgi:hypothetical protein